jgi:hypothetical protein
MFLMSTGQLSITKRSIEEGDVISLLAGSDWPVIFGRDGEQRRYVGTALVPGVLLGEVWRRDANTDEMDTFILI